MRKWKWLIIVLILGGVMAFFSLNHQSQKEIEQEQQHQLEMSIAKWLVNDYEEVEEIEFISWNKSTETGMWRTSVVINKTNSLSISFNGITGLEEVSGRSYHPDTFKLQEKPNLDKLEPVKYRVKEIEQITLDNIKIIYSDKTRR